MWKDTWMDSESLHSGGSFKHLHGAFLLGFLWSIILICLVQSPYLVYQRILPCMATLLLAKMNSTEEA